MVIFWVKTNKTKKTPSQHSLTTITRENYTSRTYFSQEACRLSIGQENKRHMLAQQRGDLGKSIRYGPLLVHSDDSNALLIALRRCYPSRGRLRFMDGYSLDGSDFPCHLLWPMRTLTGSFCLLESQTQRYVDVEHAGFLHPLGLRHFYDGFSPRAGQHPLVCTRGLSTARGGSVPRLVFVKTTHERCGPFSLCRLEPNVSHNVCS